MTHRSTVPSRSDGPLETHVEDGVATLVLARTESRNALSDGFLAEIVDTLSGLDESGDVGCAVVAGQRDYFSVGADIHELAARDPVDVLLGRRAELWRALRQVRLPLVAAVSGHCLGGGCELALSCDVIVACASASFGQPETSLGLIPGGGGTQLLVRLVGRAVAADMVLADRRLSGEEARQLGMVTQLVEDGDCISGAQALARRIAARPRVGQMLAKQALNAALETSLSGGVALERALYQIALATGDSRAALSEFAAKRAEGRSRV